MQNPETVTDEERDILSLLAEAYNKTIRLPIMFHDDARLFSDGVNALMDMIYSRAGRRAVGFFQPVRTDQRMSREEWEDWLAHNKVTYKTPKEPTLKELAFAYWLENRNPEGTMAEFEESGEYLQWRIRLPEDARINLPISMQPMSFQNWWGAQRRPFDVYFNAYRYRYEVESEQVGNTGLYKVLEIDQVGAIERPRILFSGYGSEGRMEAYRLAGAYVQEQQDALMRQKRETQS